MWEKKLCQPVKNLNSHELPQPPKTVPASAIQPLRKYVMSKNASILNDLKGVHTGLRTCKPIFSVRNLHNTV
jgi:hypothetical protein